MYKLLIVDDEPIIVDGLYELFKDWKKPYPLDVYKAYSGSEALAWLGRKRIDVVITDIKMPGIDGLQLLDRIHGSWPDCRVVFLTGHDTFEYVYRAIRHEGVKYLLKTEGYERIVETVEQFLEQIGRGLQDEELLRRAKDQLLKAGPLLQKEFLLEAAEGVRPSVRQQQLDDLQLPLRADAELLLVAGTVGEAMGGRSEPVRQSDLYAVHDAVERHMAKHASVVHVMYRNYLLWFLQTNGGEGAEALSGERFIFQARGQLEAVQSICRETLKLPVSFVLTGSTVKWQDIADWIPSLKSMLNYCSLSGMEAVLVAGGADEEETGMRIHTDRLMQRVKLQLKKLETLEIYLEQGRKESFLQAFREMKEAFAEQDVPSAVAYEIFGSFALLYISFMNRRGIADAMAERFDYERLTRFGRFDSLAAALDFLEAAAIQIFELQHRERENRSAAAVRKVQRYIQDHPECDLSLSSLADLVYFNPKYLSKLFKQETGMNLSDYIAEVKLALAKELLKRNALKVHEIAEKVGYYSAPYFTRFFKKATGLSPQEYRTAAQDRN